jgi:hypothetical protein
LQTVGWFMFDRWLAREASFKKTLVERSDYFLGRRVLLRLFSKKVGKRSYVVLFATLTSEIVTRKTEGANRTKP